MIQAMRAVSQWTDDPKAADSSWFHFDLAPGDRLTFTLRVGKERSITVTSKEAKSRGSRSDGVMPLSPGTAQC